ncbi:nucleoside triphosphate pyrophosphohydrolase [Bacillus spongiae]|uniref:Nucleoside triphosphate pyrophosphohydrolase n=1 Tax=Bacillus spongiae TaxID=2683610 RepID=A0ABU8HG67_9BACI
MPIYNKLVRDKIPEIIEKSGKSYKKVILSQEDYVKELKKKSMEELQEYLEASTNESSLEELADLLEVVHALADTHGATIDRVEELRKQKAEERGGFQEKVFLIEVEGDER